MGKVYIIGDSTCDLPKEWRDKLDVGFMPLPVIVDDKLRLDMEDVFQPEIFEHYQKTGVLCKTAAPNAQDYLDFWAKIREKDPDSQIVHFHISGDMTITHAACVEAAETLENVWSVDTRSVSIGVALLIIEACALRDQGKSGQEIFDSINQMKSRVQVGFAIDDVVYLYRSGRCSGMQAFGANLLHLHPAIRMEEGKLKPYAKYRGTKQAVANALVKELIGSANIDTRRVFIANTSFDEAGNEAMRKAITAARPDIQELIFTWPGCSICVHCGPGTIGIAYLLNA